MREKVRFGFKKRAVLACFLSLSLSFGEENTTTTLEAKNNWLDEVEFLPVGEVPLLKPCEFDIVVSWSNVVTAGRASIQIGAMNHANFPGYLMGKATGGSAGIARAFYTYDFDLWGALDRETLQAKEFRAIEKDQNGEKRTLNKKDHNGILSVSRSFDKDKIETKKRRIRFPVKQSYDLLGAILYLRSQKFEKIGDSVSVITYPFGGGYYLEMIYEGKEKHKTAFDSYDCMKFKVLIEKIDKINGELIKKKYTKFEHATLWVSDDEYRLPIEIEAKIFIGSIKATIENRRFLK